MSRLQGLPMIPVLKQPTKIHHIYGKIFLRIFFQYDNRPEDCNNDYTYQ